MTSTDEAPYAQARRALTRYYLLGCSILVLLTIPAVATGTLSAWFAPLFTVWVALTTLVAVLDKSLPEFEVPSHHHLDVELDDSVAYLRLKDGKVASTDQFSPSVLVDVADDGTVLGVEVLDTTMPLPIDGLIAKYPDLTVKTLLPLVEVMTSDRTFTTRIR